MNKKVLLILIVLVIGIITSLYFFNKDESINNKDVEIKEYDSDILCSYENDDVSEDEEPYMTNVYISYNKGGDITNVVYQTLTRTDFKDSYMSLVSSFYDFYIGLNGIDTDIYSSGDYVISTIEYDFNKLELSKIKDELGDILDDESFLLNVKIPIHYESFIDDYLSEYKCEVR